jgi:hypothetical protein
MKLNSYINNNIPKDASSRVHCNTIPLRVGRRNTEDKSTPQWTNRFEALPPQIYPIEITSAVS